MIGPIRQSTEEKIFWQREEASSGKEIRREIVITLKKKETCIASSKVLHCRTRMPLLTDTAWVFQTQLLDSGGPSDVDETWTNYRVRCMNKVWMKSVKQSWNKLKRNVRGTKEDWFRRRRVKVLFLFFVYWETLHSVCSGTVSCDRRLGCV